MNEVIKILYIIQYYGGWKNLEEFMNCADKHPRVIPAYYFIDKYKTFGVKNG